MCSGRKSNPRRREEKIVRALKDFIRAAVASISIFKAAKANRTQTEDRPKAASGPSSSIAGPGPHQVEAEEGQNVHTAKEIQENDVVTLQCVSHRMVSHFPRRRTTGSPGWISPEASTKQGFPFGEGRSDLRQRDRLLLWVPARMNTRLNWVALWRLLREW